MRYLTFFLSSYWILDIWCVFHPSSTSPPTSCIWVSEATYGEGSCVGQHSFKPTELVWAPHFPPSLKKSKRQILGCKTLIRRISHVRFAEVPELWGMSEGSESGGPSPSPMCGLISCCSHLKSLMILNQGTPHYLFALSVWNYVADSAFRINLIVFFP